jgi:O-antigen/teichoic acid export membrane protein
MDPTKSRRVAINAASSVIQVVLSGIALFELYRFITRHLTIKELGVWSLVLASTAVGRLADMGLGGGVVKFVAQDLGRNDASSAVRTVVMSLVAMGGLIAAACLISYPVLTYALSKIVVETASLQTAWELVPYALTALFVSCLSGVVLSALDGCQRMDRRAITGTIGAIVQLIAAYVLVPRFGLRGLATGQIIQAITVFSVGLAFFLRHVGMIRLQWFVWDGTRFKAMLRYGTSFQVAAIGQLLFEALLSRFGGLELTGYYEMANRMLLQLRSVIVSAFQALVPYVAGNALRDEQLHDVYVKSYRLLLLIAVPYYSSIGVASPLILTLWLGRFDARFVFTGACCLAGWSVNTMNVPSYYLYLGIGRLRWAVLSHIVIGLLVAILGSVAGWLVGGVGVLLASAVALGLGSHVVSLAFQREHGVRMSEIMPLSSISFMLIGAMGALVSTLVSLSMSSAHELALVTVYIGIVVAVLLFVLGWRNPTRKPFFRLLRQLSEAQHT